MNAYRWTIAVFAVFALALSLLKAWNKDTRGAFLLGGGVVLLGALFFITGCAVSPERQPWMEVGMAHEVSETVGSNPACIVRVRAPVGFWKIPPDWLIVGYTHHSSCRDLDDRATVDQVELMAKIPLGRRR